MMMAGKELTCLLLNPNTCQHCLSEEEHHQPERHVRRRKKQQQEPNFSSATLFFLPSLNPTSTQSLFFNPSLFTHTHPISNYTLSLLLSAIRPLPW